ncbi:hypothetical protein BFF78_09135 [Streptomyces fodineus]|uniref:Uncharacterized protein n=1 Tax=Streptomyces fodineus TaxID=1904616 RepID=A0A1D7Y750_9ACTN|nr:hypothetical protein BFF78_09135 [Streptomyces fodineus]
MAGRPLSGWSRDTRHGAWHALLPARCGDHVSGALRIDRALLAPEGTRERLAAVVLATARLRLPGLLGTVDLVAEAGEVWLLTARPPAPVLAGILSSADGPRPDAGGAAGILNETAQTLLALHTAGLTHGSLTPDTVVIAPDGIALLAEAGLAAVLGGAPGAVCHAADAGTAAVPVPVPVPVPGEAPFSDRRAADTAAWAALARTLGAAWTRPGTPAAELFARCSATAESDGLAAARAVLVAGRAALPADFLRRTALRAAAAASAPDFAPPKDRHTADPSRPTAVTDKAPASGGAPHEVVRTGKPTEPDHTPEPVLPHDRAATPTPHTRAPSPGPGPHPPTTADELTSAAWAGGEATSVGRAGGGAVPDRRAPVPGSGSHPSAADELTSAGRSGGAAVPDARAPLHGPSPHPSATADQPTTVGRAHRGTAPDVQATVVGKRNRVTRAEAPAGEGSGEILLRFGPGVAVEEQDVLRARWRTAAAVPDRQRPRRRRRGRIVTTAVVAIAAVLLCLLLRPVPAPAVVAVQVQAPAGPLHCGQTADLVGVVTTDGHGGPVTYRWLRADGQDSGELVHTAHRGERRVRVHLRWTVRGPGRFRGTARLSIAHQTAPMEAEASFTYVCP